MKKPTEEERRRQRIKTLGFVSIMTIFMIIMIGIGFVGGCYIGTKTTVDYFMNAMELVFKNSDIKIDMNMTLNQTQMMDYIFEKLNNSGLLNSSQQKEYIPPCNPDPSIPKGETGVRCVEEQIK